MDINIVCFKHFHYEKISHFFKIPIVKRIVVRHFRGHDELPPLAEENNYDFNFQDFRRFNERRIILPGDQITVECTYNTESLKRPILVWRVLSLCKFPHFVLFLFTGRIINTGRNVHGFSCILSTYERRTNMS